MVKFQKIVEGNVVWFEAKHKLCNEGIDIKKEFDGSHASIAKCEALWGKKKWHNGFKYKSCGDASLISKIQKLYLLVYQKTKITNNSIFVNFAHGLLAERKKFKVN
jgi:hypothetical protein